MYFVYLDESGDAGFIKRDKSPTKFFALGALVVKDSHWLETLNSFIYFRRYLKDEYRIPMRVEIKASHFVRNSGPFVGLDLTDKMRMNIYKMALRRQSKLDGIKTWVILFRKKEWEKKYPHLDIFSTSWQNVIERLERFTDKLNEPCIVLPDEGSRTKIRTIMRQLRRFSRPQAAYKKIVLERDAELVLEDPNFRESNQSYFVQFADYNVYAAVRAIYPEWWCGEKYWEYLGDIRDDSVNDVSRAKGKKD